MPAPEKIGDYNRTSPEYKQSLRMLSMHRANERGFNTHREDFIMNYPGKAIAVIDRGRKHIVAATEAQLISTLNGSGLGNGTEFVIKIPSPATTPE